MSAKVLGVSAAVPASEIDAFPEHERINGRPKGELRESDVFAEKLAAYRRRRLHESLLELEKAGVVTAGEANRIRARIDSHA